MSFRLNKLLGHVVISQGGVVPFTPNPLSPQPVSSLVPSATTSTPDTSMVPPEFAAKFAVSLQRHGGGQLGGRSQVRQPQLFPPNMILNHLVLRAAQDDRGSRHVPFAPGARRVPRSRRLWVSTTPSDGSVTGHAMESRGGCASTVSVRRCGWVDSQVGCRMCAA